MLTDVVSWPANVMETNLNKWNATSLAMGEKRQLNMEGPTQRGQPRKYSIEQLHLPLQQ
jgi:hypothetical protein